MEFYYDFSCGMLSPVRESNIQNVQELIDELAPVIFKKINNANTTPKLKAVLYREQTISGINYYVKVLIIFFLKGLLEIFLFLLYKIIFEIFLLYKICFKSLNNLKIRFKVKYGAEYMHVRIFKPLPYIGEFPLLHGLQLNKSLSDPIDYIELD